MNWQEALRALRPLLPTRREPWGVRGSLRWLEEAMRARGASPSAVRNIVYRDVGTLADKRALHAVLGELAAEVGVTLPPLPASAAPAPLPAELELLGRAKRRAFRQFLAGVRAGRAVRLLVSGPPGVGKTLLLEHLERELARGGRPVRRVSLGADLTAALFSPDLAAPGLHAGQPFAVQAEAQARAAAALLASLPEGGALLLHVRASGSFGGVPPRDARGQAVTPAAFAAEQLYRRAPPGVSVLLAVELLPGAAGLERAGLSADLPGDRIRLAPPTPGEARAYLMARLDLPAARADELARQAGRDLDRLTLLAAAWASQPGGGPTGAGRPDGRRADGRWADGRRLDGPQDAAERLLADQGALEVLSALTAALGAGVLGAGVLGAGVPGEEESVPAAVMQAALGRELAGLPPHLRALLDEVSPGRVRPVSAALLSSSRGRLPAALLRAALERLLEHARQGTEQGAELIGTELAPLLLRALAELGRWDELAGWLEAHPERLALAAPFWPPEARVRLPDEGPPVPTTAREALARAVVAHHAMLGRYTHPQARDALFALLDSERAEVRAWARVKLAESSVDAGHFAAAEAQLQHPELRGPLEEWRRPADPWQAGAQADALLVGAALARWRGDLAAATLQAADPRVLDGGPFATPARAALWRGLIAKDAGRWSEALGELTRVPGTYPLLSARARYQEGDLRLRLGQPGAALEALQDAHARLEAGGAPPDEQARALGRVATALRRLGRPGEALEAADQAGALAGGSDAVLRARLDSEAAPVLLALFRPDEALLRAARALSALEQDGPRRAEALYRARRTRYRAALAYLTRAAGAPYLPPFPAPEADGPDLAQARALLDALLESEAAQVRAPDDRDAGGREPTDPSAGDPNTGDPHSGDPHSGDRERLLTFDILLSRVLAEPDPLLAREFAQRALALTDHPYAEAQARAALAEVALRQQEAGAALREVNRGHALLRRVASGLNGGSLGAGGLGAGGPGGAPQTPDPGLHALLLTLEARAALLDSPDPATLRWLREALDEDPALRPFRPQVWREVAAQLERLGPGVARGALALLFPAAPFDLLRPQDAVRALLSGVPGGG